MMPLHMSTKKMKINNSYKLYLQLDLELERPVDNTTRFHLKGFWTFYMRHWTFSSMQLEYHFWKEL